MQQYLTSKYVFLLLLNVFLLIVGCLMDIFSALIVVVPLIVPVATGFGVDPVHLGIIFLTNLEIGYLTPPVGLNLFISSYRFGEPVISLYTASVPFLLLLLAGLFVITYLPAISLVLVRLVGA
jgi:TRAP-type C4-dicarboxylate transport system permease large subunit